jgi:hypothetical protein
MGWPDDYATASDALATAIISGEESVAGWLDLPGDGEAAFIVATARAVLALKQAQEILDGPTGEKSIYNSVNNLD